MACQGDVDRFDVARYCVGGPVSDRKRIMVVEDTASHRKLYSSWLRIGGYEAHMLADERDAQRCAEELRPDAIIVDIRLPNISGLDVIGQLKTAAATSAIPVMALTVLDSPQDRDACLAAGADAFVTKPDRIASFLERLSGLLAGPVSAAGAPGAAR